MGNLKEDLINIVLDEDLKNHFQERGRKITDQFKRVIGYWVKKNIVQAEQSKKVGFTLMVRNQFGLSLEIIKSVRTQLFSNNSFAISVQEVSQKLRYV